MARVLVMGPDEKESIRKVKEFAESHVLNFDDLLDIKNGTEPFVGNREGHSCIIPINFRIVYSVEMHPKKVQPKNGTEYIKLRVMSMSVPTEGKLPSVEAVKMVLPELGFTSKFEESYVTLEKDKKGEPVAIVVMEEFK